MVPALLAVAAVLTAFQQRIHERIQQWLSRSNVGSDRNGLLLGGTFPVSIYGGYFGGDRSIVLLAVHILNMVPTPERSPSRRTGH